jgi:hypothetical protein
MRKSQAITFQIFLTVNKTCPPILVMKYFLQVAKIVIP